MAQLPRKAVLLAVLIPLGAGAASAQFGGIFGDPPPRPPTVLPGRQPVTPVPPPPRGVMPPSGLPQAEPEDDAPAPPSGPYGAIQTQPLGPPPGAATADPAARGAVGALPPGAPGAPAAAPAVPTGLPPGEAPGDEVVVEPPSQRITNTGATFAGLDKITGRITKFDVAIGETVQFGALQLTTRACYTRPPTEASNTDAFVEVDELTLQGEVRRIFTGWMFAASPGLHAVEHPIYDMWLTDCKGPVVAEKPPEPPAAAPAPAQPKRPPAQPKRPPAAAMPPGVWPR